MRLITPSIDQHKGKFCPRFQTILRQAGRPLLLAVLGLLLAASAHAEKKAGEASAKRPWWDEFPLISQTDNLESAKSLGADVGFIVGQTDPSWGLFAQHLFEHPETMKKFQKAGLRTMSYYETFGTAVSYIVELDKPKKGEDHNPVKVLHWSWDKYSGGPRRWVGPQSYFDCEDYAGIYTRKHPRYGGRAMTYPDGRVATGYIDDITSDPRKSCVLDAGKAKDILGGNLPECEFQPTVNAIDPKTGKRKGPLAGLAYAYSNDAAAWGYTGNFGFQKDSACPYWIDLQHSSILYAADHGLDGIWTDNFGPWDSLGYPATYKAFGDWSVAGFRTYLSRTFSAEQLKAMGVEDVKTFDIRTALRAKARAWGGDDKNLDAPVWNQPRWMEEPLWRAYLIYKRQSVSTALRNYYNATKEAGRQAGKPDFFVAGNDTPYFSLGCPRGFLDMVSVETTPGWHMGTSARGAMLPPTGHYSPIFKLAREHAKSRFVNVWMYMNNAYTKYQGKGAVASALYYEALANHALPMMHPDLSYVAGNPAVNAAFFKFVKSVRDTFGGRTGVEDIGIYYSSSSVLMSLTPNGFIDMDHQVHQFGYYGWGTALGELHYQYRAIPEWKLNPQTLAGLRVLIIPDAEVFDPSDVKNVLEPWVKAGGLLIVTGNSGYRLGESGNFEPNGSGSSLSNLTCSSTLNGGPVRYMNPVGAGRVLYIKENLGMLFYVADKARPQLLPLFQEAMDEVRKDSKDSLVLSAGSEVPSTAGLVLYQDAQAKRLFVDVYNSNLEIEKDTMIDTPALRFTVKLPEWLRERKGHSLQARVLAPTGSPTAAIRMVSADCAEISLTPVQYYASVVLELGRR